MTSFPCAYYASYSSHTKPAVYCLNFNYRPELKIFCISVIISRYPTGYHFFFGMMGDYLIYDDDTTFNMEKKSYHIQNAEVPIDIDGVVGVTHRNQTLPVEGRQSRLRRNSSLKFHSMERRSSKLKKHRAPIPKPRTRKRRNESTELINKQGINLVPHEYLIPVSKASMQVEGSDQGHVNPAGSHCLREAPTDYLVPVRRSAVKAKFSGDRRDKERCSQSIEEEETKYARQAKVNMCCLCLLTLFMLALVVPLMGATVYLFVNVQSEKSCCCDQQNDNLNDFIKRWYGLHEVFPASSCQEMLSINSSLPSGNYWITGGNVFSIPVYCEMTITCGKLRGWRRVASFNANEPGSCLRNFSSKKNSNRSVCAPQNTENNLTTITIPVYNIEYSNICSKIKVFDPRSSGPNTTSTEVNGNGIFINSAGSDPKQYIWSFLLPDSGCNCSSSALPLGRASTDYFCLTPLESCQGNPSQTFFKTVLPNANNLEVQVYHSGIYSFEEDISIESLQLYVL